MIPRFSFFLVMLGVFGGSAWTADAAQLTIMCDPVPALFEPASATDVAREADYCAIDLSGDDVAICPKTWSTSPGAVIYDLGGTEWQGRVAAFENSSPNILDVDLRRALFLRKDDNLTIEPRSRTSDWYQGLLHRLMRSMDDSYALLK